MQYNIGMPATASPPRFSDSEFVSQEKLWLKLAHEGDVEPVDKEALRQWLTEAPGRLRQTSLAAWTSLAGLLLWVTHDSGIAHPKDGHLVRKLLDHALTVPIHMWMAEGEPLVKESVNPNHVPSDEEDEPSDHDARPAYDALRGLTGMMAMAEAGLGPHPTLTAVLASGWQPGPLLAHLEQAREIQMLYCERPQTLTRTAQGYLVDGILSAIGTSEWRPEAHPAMALLWGPEVQEYYSQEPDHTLGQERLRSQELGQAAQRVFQAFPEHAAQALRTFVDMPALRRHMGAAAFFPFPFDKSHDVQTLGALLRCWQQRDNVFHRGTKGFCDELTRHHPDVANLLEMHCSFYTQPNHALNNLPSIIEAFEHVVGVRENQMLNIDHLDLGS